MTSTLLAVRAADLARGAVVVTGDDVRTAGWVRRTSGRTLVEWNTSPPSWSVFPADQMLQVKP